MSVNQLERKEIVSVGNSKTQYKLRFNPANYPPDPFLDGKNAFRKDISIIDEGNIATIDPGRLIAIFHSLRSKDFKYFFYIIAKMQNNNDAVHCPHNEMKRICGDKYVQNVADGIERLVQAGLIFRVEHKLAWYIVNPVYAWKGGKRIDFLSPEVLADCA